jgi:hypothetical protein
VVLFVKELKQAAAWAGETEMVAAVKDTPIKASKTKATQKRFTMTTASQLTAHNIGKEDSYLGVVTSTW